MRERDRVVATDAAAAAVIASVVVGLILLSGGIWAHVGGSDLHGMFLPRYEAAARAIVHDLRLPLWNPWELCGAPLLGSGQAAALYPPLWVAFATLPSWAALQTLYGFHVLVLAWGTLAYLRRHAIPRAAAGLGVLVAVAGVLTGSSRAGVDHPAFLGSVAWVPIMLLAWERAVAERVRPWLGVLALAYAMQWLAGYPEFPMDTPILIGLVALVTPLGSVSRRLGTLAGGLALGAALAAIQILPVADAVAWSARDVGPALEGLRRALARTPISDLLGGFGVPGFAAIVFLVVVALPGRSRVVLGWVLAVTWATFALDPPLVALYQVPPYAGVRFPLAWGQLAAFFVGLLAAAGTSAHRSASGPRRAIPLALAVVAAVAAVRAIASAPLAFDPRVALADPVDRDVLDRRADVVRQGLEAGGPRFVAGLELRTGMPLRRSLHSAGGYEPAMPPRRIARLLDEAGIGTVGRPRWPIMHQRAHLLDRLGVGTLVVPPAFIGPPLRRGFERVSALPSGEVVLAKPALPRARVVHAVVRAASEEEAFRLVTDPRLQPGAAAVVEGDVAVTVEPAVPGSTEGVRIARDEPEHVEIDVDLASVGLLVLTDTYAPGWQADVDGEPAEVLLADYAFRAVPVPRGVHRVTLRYRPTSVVLGGGVTLAAGLAVFFLLVPWRSTSWR